MDIFTKNLDAIQQRYGDAIAEQLRNAPDEASLTLFKSKKQDCYTARYEKIYLHSAYNPLREASQLAKSILQEQNKNAHDGIVFLGFGLGYHIAEITQKTPELSLIIVEPSIERMAQVLRNIDYASLFSNTSLVFCFEEDPADILATIKKSGARIPLVWEQEHLTFHRATFFSEISAMLYRYSTQGRLNRNTLIKFSKKWIQNCIRNLIDHPQAYSIDLLQNSFSGMPALLCAAGPSFDSIIPYLSEWKKKSVIIAVDTIVHRLESLGCPPDIVVSMDPQYWNSRHLDYCDLTGMILIVDSSTCPRILHKIRKNGGIPFFAASHFPLAAYLDPYHNTKLGAGGSVSTSAWDLCTFLGCSSLFCIGLDLGYPLHRTHARHSLYEQVWSWTAHRLAAIETPLVHSLFNAAPYYVENYAGHKILSDTRLELYSFWFTEAARSVEAHTLSLLSKKIEGIAFADPASIARRASISEEKERLLHKLVELPPSNDEKIHQDRLQRIHHLLKSLKELQSIVEQQLQTIAICMASERLAPKDMHELAQRDQHITKNPATPFVNFLLQSAARSVFSFLGKDKALENSRGIYKAYKEAINFYITILDHYSIKS